MGVKAVYASGTLSLYVTGADILPLLNGHIVSANLRIGSVELSGAELHAHLDENALKILPGFVQAERELYGNTPLRMGAGGWQFGDIEQVVIDAPTRGKRKRP